MTHLALVKTDTDEPRPRRRERGVLICTPDYDEPERSWLPPKQVVGWPADMTARDIAPELVDARDFALLGFLELLLDVWPIAAWHEVEANGRLGGACGPPVYSAVTWACLYLRLVNRRRGLSTRRIVERLKELARRRVIKLVYHEGCLVWIEPGWQWQPKST